MTAVRSSRNHSLRYCSRMLIRPIVDLQSFALVHNKARTWHIICSNDIGGFFAFSLIFCVSDVFDYNVPQNQVRTDCSSRQQFVLMHLADNCSFMSALCLPAEMTLSRYK